MRCMNCGAQIDDNAFFCPVCGELVNRGEQNTGIGNSPVSDETAPPVNTSEQNVYADVQRCPACGTEVTSDLLYCGTCGYRLSSPEPTQYQKKSSKAGYIIGIAAGLTALIGIVVFISFNVFSRKFNIDPAINSNNLIAGSSTAAPTAASVINTPVAPVNDRTPISPVIERTQLYSPGYTYKRINDEIHLSKPSSDDLYLEIKAVIEDFDKECESYMNYGGNGVFKYLTPGTTAYNQQTNYKSKHPDLFQEYLEIRVEDVRDGGGYTYAWVKEVLSVTENGENRTETSHWVYELEYSNGGWSIVDYTKDPAF